jgi:predicted AlkP superfamily phosphohydrolase/phosphomutase
MLALFQLDAVALPVIESMLAEGRLPVLAGLKSRGRWEALDTKATILQSATYPTLCTGIDVREHGLYSAFPWSPSDQRVRFLHTFPKPPTIWDRLSARGRRALVVDPILSWPPRNMAGVYLSGWQFEDRMLVKAESVPRGERTALSRRHGRSPRLDDVYGKRHGSSLVALLEHLMDGPRRAADAVLDELERDRFELLWLNFSAAHKAGHHLWDPAAVTEEQLDDELARTLRKGLEDVYEAVDAALGRTLDALPDDTDVIVFSPTGMGANTSRADLLPGMLHAVLNENGARREQSPDGVRTPVWSLRSSIPPEWRSRAARLLPDRLIADMTTRLYVRADWTSTRAMAVPGENKGYIRLNLAGREREGIVQPSEGEELLETISTGLATFCDPDGSAAIARVDLMSELAGELSYAERLPDLVVTWGDGSAARLQRVSSPRYGDVERRGVGSGRSGNHVDDAWTLLAPGGARIRELGRAATIKDVGATACSLLDADLTGLSGEPLLER